MKPRLNSGFTLAIIAAASVAALSLILFAVAKSFRSSISEIVESKTRVTVVNKDGSVFYDTDRAKGNHAGREEIRNAFTNGYGVALRHSDSLNCDLLYSARKVGDRVVRLAVPYTGVLKSERLAWAGLSAALALGTCVVLFVFLATAKLTKRIDEQTRRLEIATANETFRREFTSNVTHELKSPLTAIQGAVELLGDGSNLSDEERKDLFNIIHNESSRLGSLVGDILSLARIEKEGTENIANLVPISLDELIKTVVERAKARVNAAHMNIDITKNDPAYVKADASKIEEVLRNLIDNALHYSGSDSMEISSEASADAVTVSVIDYGIGITAEHLPHIFERFYRVSKSRSRSLGGTGLGLAIVKHLVQLHGGTVSATSVPGLRTVFSFTIPRLAGMENQSASQDARTAFFTQS